MKRYSKLKRVTNETKIEAEIQFNSTKQSIIDTKVGFFNHMLELFAKHGNFYIKCIAEGDIDVDFHHLVEDTGIVLGQIIKEAVGEKIGIKRYSTKYIPMMETLSRVSIDFSGRGYLYMDYDFSSSQVGEFDTELVQEFFYSLCINSGINAHIDVIRGENTHHIIESIFKAFSRALEESVEIINNQIPTTKGVL